MSNTPIRVAIVDDEPSVRTALARLLSASSFEAKTYGSAEEFIESIRAGVPECLVVDIHMPELTGLDLQRYLARAGIKIPTMVITAFNDVETREQCAAIGAIAFLTKPLHGPTLIDTIRKAAAPLRA
jgi:FixJ family two-component response regulator